MPPTPPPASPVSIGCFTTSPAVTLATQQATNLAPTSATLKGAFTGDGNDTHYHFEYIDAAGFQANGNSYTGAANPISTPEKDAGSETGPRSATADITGLSFETTYHYRLVATNSFGTTFGNDRSLTAPPAVAVLVTNPATNVVAAGATLNGAFNPAGHDTHYHFEYIDAAGFQANGNSYTGAASPTSTPDADAGQGTVSQALSADISGLQPQTTYHFRILATNDFGTTLGADQTFTTSPAVLAVSTRPATNVQPTTATLNAQLNPAGEDTHFRFEYGPDISYGQSTADADAGSSAGRQSIMPTSPASAPKPPTTSARRNQRLRHHAGADQTFTTSPAVRCCEHPPGDKRAPTTATLNLPQPRRRRHPLPLRIRHRHLLRPEHRRRRRRLFDQRQSLSADISGLQPQTTYHFGLVATNAFGTTHGQDRTFTTPPAVAGLATGQATNVEETTVTLNGQLNPAGEDTHFRFEYGPDTSYGQSTAEETPVPGSGVRA